jgi:hypothetical protein
MTKRRVLCWLIFLVPTALGAREPTPLGQVAIEFFGVAKAILSSGAGLIDQLATTQAKSVVSDIYTQATDLVNAKMNLRKHIEDGSAHDVGGLLFGQVHSLGYTITRFGAEIDKVSGLHSGPLRNATHNLTMDKGTELKEVNQALYRGDKKAALESLDAAIDKTKKIMKAAVCLKGTLERKKAACDAETLEPILDSK